MSRLNALAYVCSTGDRDLDDKILDMIERHCNKQGYNVVMAIGEHTDRSGCSEEFSYMFIGMAAEDDIDVVVTASKEMLGDSKKAIELITKLDAYDVYVETVADDLDKLYTMMRDGCVECDSIEECLGKEADDDETLLSIISASFGTGKSTSTLFKF